MRTSIVYNGKTYTPRKARKEHRCIECPLPIFPGEDYWEITLGGSGLGDIKFPDRVHTGDCRQKNIAGGK